MYMNVIKKWMLLFVLLLTALTAHTQNDLHIENIFRDYGKQDGSVLIELAQDVLGNHTQIDHYKSLIIPSGEEVVRATSEAIRKDLEDSAPLMESQKNGSIEKAYYCLKKKEDAAFYEYILFSNKAGKMTLIYVKGDFPPARLEREMNKLKDLFIKVNNKRIKF
jgi:ribulose kinase